MELRRLSPGRAAFHTLQQLMLVLVPAPLAAPPQHVALELPVRYAAAQHEKRHRALPPLRAVARQPLFPQTARDEGEQLANVERLHRGARRRLRKAQQQ